MRTEFLCISVSRVASGPRVKLASCKRTLTRPTPHPRPSPPLPRGLLYPVDCSTDCSKAVVPVLVLLFVALWFILRGHLLYVFPCVILFLCFSVLLVLRLPRLGKRELILVLFVRLFGLCLFRFVGFLFLLGSGKGCDLWLWHSLDFSLTFFLYYLSIYSKDISETCHRIGKGICRTNTNRLIAEWQKGEKKKSKKKKNRHRKRKKIHEQSTTHSSVRRSLIQVLTGWALLNFTEKTRTLCFHSI